VSLVQFVLEERDLKTAPVAAKKQDGVDDIGSVLNKDLEAVYLLEHIC
jgi:hypothetical protein